MRTIETIAMFDIGPLYECDFLIQEYQLRYPTMQTLSSLKYDDFASRLKVVHQSKTSFSGPSFSLIPKYILEISIPFDSLHFAECYRLNFITCGCVLNLPVFCKETQIRNHSGPKKCRISQRSGTFLVSLKSSQHGMCNRTFRSG